MVKDFELYREWKVNYPTLNASEVAKVLSGIHDFSWDSIRGRLSRVDTIENRVEIAKILSEPTWNSDSVRRQEEIINKSKVMWELKRGIWEKYDRPIVGYFISDMHRGAKVRNDYWRMTLELLDKEEHVDVISAFNDWLDNKGWGRWDDTRSSVDKVWSGDVQNSFKLEDFDYETLVDITGATLVGILGNHDAWIYKFWRSNSPQSAEQHVADRMEQHYDNGVLMFNRMTYQNSLEMSPGLVWEHGTSAAKRISSRARGSLPLHMREGVAKSVVVGHSHRPGMMDGAEIDYHGVSFANAGTYQRADEVGYSRDNNAVGWKGGVVRCEFHPLTRNVNLSLTTFEDRGDKAVAIKDGTTIMQMDKD